MRSQEVLNPDLFRRLQCIFEEVRVEFPRESRVVQPREHRPPIIEQDGERYCVCCKFCRDDQFLLKISHLFGLPDEVTAEELTDLAECHWCNCLMKPENLQTLINDLTSDGQFTFYSGEVEEGRRVSDDSRIVEMPNRRVRIDELKENHPAVVFLKERGLNVTNLGKIYEVMYCFRSDDEMAYRKILIPVRQNGKSRGWLAMLADFGSNSPPEYYAAPEMIGSRLIYNFDRAKNYETGVIVKSAEDVWKFGPMAMSFVTPTFSGYNMQTLYYQFQNRTLVAAFPSAAFGNREFLHFIDLLENDFWGRFAAVELPGVELDRECLRHHVAVEAMKKGVRVNYAKKQ